MMKDTEKRNPTPRPRGTVIPVNGRYKALYQTPIEYFYKAKREGKPLPPKRPSRRFSTKSEAHAWLNEEYRLIDLGIWTPPAEREQAAKQAAITFHQYAEKWLDRRKKDGSEIAPSTKRKNRENLENHLLPVFGSMKLADITPADIKEWLATYEPGSTVPHNCFSAVLKPMFTAACNDIDEATGTPVIETNPCAHINVPRPKRKHTPTAVTYEQVTALADAMPERLRLGVYLGFIQGLRIGEVLALRRCDIDLKKGVIHVAGSLSLVDGEDNKTRTVRGKTKTPESEASIPIAPVLEPMIRNHLGKFTGKKKEACLFSTARGNPMYESRFNAHFRVARASVGLDDLHFHDARHNITALLANVGAPVTVVKRILRHAQTSTTMDVYMDVVSEQSVQQAMSRISEEATKHLNFMERGEEPELRELIQATAADPEPVRDAEKPELPEPSGEIAELAAWLETQSDAVRLPTLRGFPLGKRLEVLSAISDEGLRGHLASKVIK